jgi:hypothetical protein
MSARSIYVRDRAANCEWRAKNIRDDETEVALREIAARYVAEADDIEKAKSWRRGKSKRPPIFTTTRESVHVWRAT